jgi:1,4-dihydroxy-2-naphthoate octaprenyltransferase
MALRPQTLLIAVVPVVVGMAIAKAEGAFSAGPALAALLGAIFIQIGTNLANDVYDHERGADNEARLGPPRATQLGLLRPRAVKIAMLLSFVCATGFGFYLLAVAGWLIVPIGWASMLAAWAYTGGPYPLAYHGLGDVAVMVFFGLLAVIGTVWVQGAPITALAWGAAVGVGAVATAVLAVNNVRDVDTDILVGKRTLPVRFGRGFGVAEYAAMLLLAQAIPVGLVLLGEAPRGALLTLVMAPWSAWVTAGVARERGRDLNHRLFQTVRMLVLYGALLAVGLLLPGGD